MARIKGKGEFSGKMSNIVFATWNGIPYVRASPHWKRKYKPSARQVLNQQKFRFGMKLVSDFRNLLNFSIEFEKGQSSCSSTMRTLLNEAILGEYPDLSVDYSRLLVAKGSLPPATGALAELEGRLIKFRWTDETDKVYKDHYGNHSILVAYHPATRSVFRQFNGPIRSQLSGVLNISDYQLKGELHTWLAFRSTDFKLKANSVYTGQLLLNG